MKDIEVLFKHMANFSIIKEGTNNFGPIFQIEIDSFPDIEDQIQFEEEEISAIISGVMPLKLNGLFEISKNVYFKINGKYQPVMILEQIGQ